jgi:hypothetical protein
VAVVKNLMIRIGADFSGARKGMQGASKELDKFKKDTTKATSTIRGKNGLGGISAEMKELGKSTTESLSRLRGAKGIEGATAAFSALRPAVRSVAASVVELGAAAAGAELSLGTVGIALGALTIAAGLGVAAIAKASQTAVKFEADLGRLQMQLKGSTRAYMDWARAQGLARSTAADMGSTYAVLLSSFIHNNTELRNQTENFVRTTRIVASATGRSIEDVTERMRSGLLGNTEAIEDLGIFVNVSMIESTKAFKKFANGKHWEQLNYQTQQQIRLQAILEQAYDRYGNTLQNNVMTRQTQLSENLKDIKLNLSQAFLPIWDAVLPLLTKMSAALATTTENVARFIYSLRGWDYDTKTRGAEAQAGAVSDLGNAYDQTGKQAAKAEKQVASFDKLNLIGKGGGSGAGTGGSSGTSGSSGANGSGSSANGPSLSQFPPLVTTKFKIEIEPPNPPDGGMGGVATAITNTVNGMTAQVRSQWHGMLDDMQAQLNAYRPYLEYGFGLIGVAVSAIRDPAGTAKAAWHDMLDYMQSQLNAYNPYLMYGWKLLTGELLGIQNTNETVKAAWHDMLDYMQSQLNAYSPYITYGWKLLIDEIGSIKSTLEDVKSAWSNALSDMYNSAANWLDGIVGKIESVVSAWSRLKQAITGSPARVPEAPQAPVTSPASSPSFGQSILTTGQNQLSQFGDYLKNAFSADTLSKIGSLIQNEAAKPQNQAAATIFGALLSGGMLSKGASLGDLLKSLPNLLKSGAVPAFAAGAMVYGPTLAMVGDNRGAASDPEVVAPLSKLGDYMDGSGDDAEMIALLRGILQAVKENRTVQAVIGRDAIGQAASDYIVGQSRRGRNPIQPSL